jgi:DNA replication protein DnaC
MLSIQSFEMLKKLNLNAFANEFEEQEKNGGYQEFTFHDRLSLLLQREILERENKNIKRKMTNAKIKQKASLENVKVGQERGLDKVTLQSLNTCEWIKRKQNIIITGATGVGKSFLSSALAEKSCRSGYQARYFRYQNLLSELIFSTADGSLKNYLNKLEKFNVLIIDDWALHSITESEQKYLFELIELRSETSSTIFVSQTPISKWHSLMPNSTIADAILDRIVHTAIRIELKGESMRKNSERKIDEEGSFMK